jgi:hypothetical protein
MYLSLVPPALVNGLTVPSFVAFLSCFAGLPLFLILATLASCKFHLAGPIYSVTPLGRTAYAGEYCTCAAKIHC